MPLREHCACFSGPNVITLYKLGVTEAGGAHRLMTFYCYCSATINCSPLLLLLLRGSYLQRGGAQKQQIENIATVIQRKMINLSIKLLF